MINFLVEITREYVGTGEISSFTDTIPANDADEAEMIACAKYDAPQPYHVVDTKIVGIEE